MSDRPQPNGTPETWVQQYILDVLDREGWEINPKGTADILEKIVDTIDVDDLNRRGWTLMQGDMLLGRVVDILKGIK
jgi:hypothetical protein